MLLLGLSFAGLHVLVSYLTFRGPADLDRLDARFAGQAVQVRSLEADSPFARAGLRAGDQVLAVGGQPLRSARDWTVALANRAVGETQVWVVARGGQRLELPFVAERATLANRLWHGYLIYTAMALGCFLLGLLILLRKPGDPVARLGAWFIMTASVAFGLPNGWAAVWRGLPVPIQVLLWVPQLSRFVIEAIFLSFIVVFPRRMFRSSWPWALIWAPVVATLPWRAWGFHAVVHPPPGGLTLPDWLGPVTFLRTVAYVVSGVALLLLSYRGLVDVNERRRVRVLMAGTAVSLVAAVPVVWGFTFRGYGLGGFMLVVPLAFPLTLACPAAFAHAILRHRLFDIRVILRQGLRYALARGAVLGVVPALGVVLVADLTASSRQPLAEVVSARGWAYALLGGLALLAHWRRVAWLEALDRRFFRERYNAQRLLREVAGEIRASRSLDRAALVVVARVEAALHAEFVALMVRQPGDGYYHALAAAPPALAPPALPAGSRLIALARVLQRPLDNLLSQSSWIEQRLPPEEIQPARAARIDLLLPIAASPAGVEAILVLGGRRSEEPYAQDDQELLEAIAASLALLLEPRPETGGDTTSSFGECSRCGACLELSAGACGCGHETLAIVRLPRVLAGRYRLDRRLGHGGMGTVYEATDTALSRGVAVKVLREDLVGHREAAQRFGREARAAASFAHPNVVTVHDFGVEAGPRAFIVMELLRGSTLRDELRAAGRLPRLRVVEVLRGVCAAVGAAHDRQLVHRDLKPENIFVSRGAPGDSAPEVVKVLDFGLAKFLSAEGPSLETATETGRGVLLGTLPYLSPGQLTGERPHPRWDLWALAVVAYEMLTGVHPFGQAGSEDWQRAVLAGDFVPLGRRLSDPPARAQAFFARCFAARAADRPGSAAELFDGLQRALA